MANIIINYLNSDNSYEVLYPYTSYSLVQEKPSSLDIIEGNYIGTGTFGEDNPTKIPTGTRTNDNGTFSIISSIYEGYLCFIRMGSSEYHQIGWITKFNESKIESSSYYSQDYDTIRKNICICSTSANWQMNSNMNRYRYKIFLH